MYTKCTDRLHRIVRILRRLYEFVPVGLSETAEEYGVSERTIRRDLELISQAIPLRRERGSWRIDPVGRREGRGLGRALLQAFAENARIRAACLDDKSADPTAVDFAVRYHRLPRELGEEILSAILRDRVVEFGYRDKEGRLSLRRVAPVKLLSAQGFWYLIGWDLHKELPRTFRLDRIHTLRLLPEARDLEPETLRALGQIRDPWSNSLGTPEPILLYADAYAAAYLRDVPLHPSQEIRELHTEGSALFSYRVTHIMEILPGIKSWIPHLRVLEPEKLRRALIRELCEYVGEDCVTQMSQSGAIMEPEEEES